MFLYVGAGVHGGVPRHCAPRQEDDQHPGRQHHPHQPEIRLRRPACKLEWATGRSVRLTFLLVKYWNMVINRHFPLAKLNTKNKLKL